MIDEVQLAPELFRSIKVTVDTDQRPGQFLLTGSAQVLALRGLPDALPGRMEIVELWPFSQGELERSPDAFVDAAFVRGPGLSRTSTLRKRDYLDRVVRGGYPEAARRSPRRRAAFFDSYLTNLIERDVKELAAIERRGDPSPAAGIACRPFWRPARSRHARDSIRHSPDHAESLPRAAIDRLSHQADPCLVNWSVPAGHRHAEARLRRHRHCRAPARPGHRPSQ